MKDSDLSCYWLWGLNGCCKPLPVCCPIPKLYRIILLWLMSQAEPTRAPIFFCLSRYMTKPTKWLCAKRRLRSALAWVAKDPSFLHADSEDSDQTGRMSRLIWVFAGRTCHFVGFVMRRLIYAFVSFFIVFFFFVLFCLVFASRIQQVEQGKNKLKKLSDFVVHCFGHTRRNTCWKLITACNSVTPKILVLHNNEW